MGQLKVSMHWNLIFIGFACLIVQNVGLKLRINIEPDYSQDSWSQDAWNDFTEPGKNPHPPSAFRALKEPTKIELEDPPKEKPNQATEVKAKKDSPKEKPNNATEVEAKKDIPKEKPKGELKPASEIKAKLPEASKGPEPPKPQEKKERAAIRGGWTKPTCDHECLGNNRCKHVSMIGLFTLFGECYGTTCAGVTEECGPCYEKCEDIVTEPTCDYDCYSGKNKCRHITSYPDLNIEIGECAGDNCVGVTEECGSCLEKCPNIKTETECEYSCGDSGFCIHKTSYSDGGVTSGYCRVWGWGTLKHQCNGVTKDCKPCYQKCYRLEPEIIPLF